MFSSRITLSISPLYNLNVSLCSETDNYSYMSNLFSYFDGSLEIVIEDIRKGYSELAVTTFYKRKRKLTDAKS